MNTMWFYDRNGRKGPVGTEDLIRALSDTKDPRRVKLWREGLPTWVEAGSIEEISTKLPPPVTSGSGTGFIVDAANLPTDRIDAVAGSYRMLVLLVGAQLVVGLVLQLMADPVIGLLLLLVLLVIAVMMAVSAYRVMDGLGSAIPVLWAVAIFIPLLNLLVLAAISSRAQSWCKSYGIKVGFLGPTPASLGRVRERTSKDAAV